MVKKLDGFEQYVVFPTRMGELLKKAFGKKNYRSFPARVEVNDMNEVEVYTDINGKNKCSSITHTRIYPQRYTNITEHDTGIELEEKVKDTFKILFYGGRAVYPPAFEQKDSDDLKYLRDLSLYEWSHEDLSLRQNIGIREVLYFNFMDQEIIELRDRNNKRFPNMFSIHYITEGSKEKVKDAIRTSGYKRIQDLKNCIDSKHNFNYITNHEMLTRILVSYWINEQR